MHVQTKNPIIVRQADSSASDQHVTSVYMWITLMKCHWILVPPQIFAGPTLYLAQVLLVIFNHPSSVPHLLSPKYFCSTVPINIHQLCLWVLLFYLYIMRAKIHGSAFYFVGLFTWPPFHEAKGIASNVLLADPG